MDSNGFFTKIMLAWVAFLYLCASGAFFAFLGLRLSHTIDWSWWFITAPYWAMTVIVIFYALVFSFFALISRMLDL